MVHQGALQTLESHTAYLFIIISVNKEKARHTCSKSS